MNTKLLPKKKKKSFKFFAEKLILLRVPSLPSEIATLEA